MGAMSIDRAVSQVRRSHVQHRVVVFDIDGVLRTFDVGSVDADLEERLGLAAGAWAQIAFGLPHLTQVVTGRISFTQWCHSIAAALEGRGADPDLIPDAVADWVAYRGTPVPATLALLEEFRADGVAVFLFTNGTDNIPDELRQIGLGHLVDLTLNSAVFGVAKPAPEAFAAAHAAIEEALGPIPRSDVLFTDDRPANAKAATDFGWTGVHFDARPAPPA